MAKGANSTPAVPLSVGGTNDGYRLAGRRQLALHEGGIAVGESLLGGCRSSCGRRDDNAMSSFPFFGRYVGMDRLRWSSTPSTTRAVASVPSSSWARYASPKPDRLDPSPRHVLIQLDRSSVPLVRHLIMQISRASIMIPCTRRSQSFSRVAGLSKRSRRHELAADGDGDSRRSFGIGQASPQVVRPCLGASPACRTGSPVRERRRRRPCFRRIACQSDS